MIQLHGIALDLDEAYVVMERGVENLSQKIKREVDIYMASLERRFVSLLIYIYIYICMYVCMYIMTASHNKST